MTTRMTAVRWAVVAATVLAAVTVGASPGAARGQARSPGAPFTEVWFNHPLDSHYIAESPGSISDRAPAGSLIQYAMFKFTDRLTARLLDEAAQRGVHVEVVLDGAPPSPCEHYCQGAIKALSDLNVIHRDDPLTWYVTCAGIGPNRPAPLPRAGDGCIGQQLNHNKFMLVSRSSVIRTQPDGSGALHPTPVSDAVLVSSRNDARRSQPPGFNDGVNLYNQPGLYLDLQRYFDRLAAAALQPGRKTQVVFTPRTGNDAVTKRIGAHDLATWTFPRAANDDPVAQVFDGVPTTDGCRNRTGAAGGPRHTQVDAAILDIAGRRSLLRRLAELHRSGCSVDIVYTGITPGARRYLTHQGVAIHRLCETVDSPEGYAPRTTLYVHDKYFLVDGTQRRLGANRRAVYTGSENWTDRALTEADNLVLRYVERAGDSPVFDAYAADFRHLLEVSKQSPQHGGQCRGAQD